MDGLSKAAKAISRAASIVVTASRGSGDPDFEAVLDTFETANAALDELLASNPGSPDHARLKEVAYALCEKHRARSLAYQAKHSTAH